MTSSENALFQGNEELESARRRGDLQFQRRHVWAIIAALSSRVPNEAQPAFESWYGEEQVFGSAAASLLPQGIRGFFRPRGTTQPHAMNAAQSAGVPVITYTLYNRASFQHIRRNRLNRIDELERLQKEGPIDGTYTAERTVPAFPESAIVMKTVWWPVARAGLTALPAWDPDANPPLPSGNGYLGWRRIVAIDPAQPFRNAAIEQLDFAAHSFSNPRRVSLDEFYHVRVDARMAQRLMRDPETAKAVSIVLGRHIEAGDFLALIAANVATKEIENWVWATFWWHDLPSAGPFALDRPSDLVGEWRHYLMQTAFDAEKPRAEDGGPHVCFDPWLEARFPDGGQGAGITSNCLACHRRASLPLVGFLPVTRGNPDEIHDPAFASGRLRTNFLWSLAMHARP